MEVGGVRITSKGQVTIPQAIREQAGLLPNTEIEFVLDGDLVYLVRAGTPRKPTRGTLLVEHLRRHGEAFTLSTDELLALTRGEDG
jgi:AbrB family looped-hinge helix DNA binding protein